MVCAWFSLARQALRTTVRIGARHHCPAQRPTKQGKTRACRAPYSHWKHFPVRVWCSACSCFPLQGKHCERSCGAEHAITHSAAANRARKLRTKKSNIHIRNQFPYVDVALLSTQFPCKASKLARVVWSGTPSRTAQRPTKQGKMSAKKATHMGNRLIFPCACCLLRAHFPCLVGRCNVREGVPLHTSLASRLAFKGN